MKVAKAEDVSLVPARTAGENLLSPKGVISLTVAYLCAAWTAFLLVDVLNVASTRDSLVASGFTTPAIWAQLFREGGPTEILQWLYLGGAAIVSAFLAGELRERGRNGERELHAFWLLMSIALIVMLIEDAGNPRHYLRNMALRLTGSRVAQLTVESVIFAVIAGLPLYAVIRYWRWVVPFARSKWYLFAAFVAYGVAGAASATRYAWYERAGTWLNQFLGGRLLQDLEHPFFGTTGMEFFLMDWLWEESVELIGATFFLAAALGFLGEVRNSRLTADRVQE